MLADLVSMLTFALFELGTDNVWMGVKCESENKQVLVLSPTCSWMAACRQICGRFQKEFVCAGRQIDLLAPCQMYPSPQEIEIARVIPCCMTQEEERGHWASLFSRTKKARPPVKSRLGHRSSSSSRSSSSHTRRSSGSGSRTERRGTSGAITKANTGQKNKQPPTGPSSVALMAARGPELEQDLPSSSAAVVMPRRFVEAPDFGYCCGFCGQRSAKKHRTKELCPKFLNLRKKYGRDTTVWPARICRYELCTAPATHETFVCPDLHARCTICKVRGHLKGRLCNKDNLRLLGAYEASKNSGYLTAAGRDEPQWEFAPPTVDLAEIDFLGKKHLVDWSPSQHAEYLSSDMTQRRRMLSKEYHR